MLPVKVIFGLSAASILWGLAPHVACQKSSLAAIMGNDSSGRSSAGFPHTTAISKARPAPAPDSIPRAATGLRMLALGDSYTIGESVSDSERYPVQVVHELRTNDDLSFEPPDIIATTGWTTGNLLDALSAAPPTGPYDAVTLLIGVNNQYQHRSSYEFAAQFTTLLRRSIELAGNQPSHVLVLSIPDYSVTPFGRSTPDPARIAAEIDSFNAINRQLAGEYKVNWLDITGESRKAAGDPTLIAADGLHFSGKEYAVWARLMESVIKGMVHQ